MAISKKNDIGTKRSLFYLMLYARKCGICKTKLTYLSMQLDHVTSRKTAKLIGNGLDNSFGNIAALCKTCNSAKGSAGIEYYAEHNFETYKFILGFQKLANGFTDMRQLLKLNLRNIENKIITAKFMADVCDSYAISNSSGKFARLHREGIYYQPKV